MQVQIHTDNHIEGSEAMAQWARETVQTALARYVGQITRVEAHLSDLHAGKKTGADNLQCTLEARLEGLAPVAVKQQAANLNQAISGAVDKLLRAIEHAQGKAKA